MDDWKPSETALGPSWESNPHAHNTEQEVGVIANISQLNERLWTGGDLSPDPMVARNQLRNIVDAGITTIIDTRLEWTDEDFISEHSELNQVWLGVDDHGGQQPLEWWEAGCRYAREALDDGDNVLIHCHMGINRGPSLAGLVLVDYFGMDPVDAWNLVRKSRPFAWAIYMPDGVGKLFGKRFDAIRLRQWIESNDDGTMEETIGRIRSLQSGGAVINPFTVMRGVTK